MNPVRERETATGAVACGHGVILSEAKDLAMRNYRGRQLEMLRCAQHDRYGLVIAGNIASMGKARA